MIIDLDSWETGYADGQLGRRRNARSSLIRHRTRWVSAKVAPPARECARTRRGCVILCYRSIEPNGPRGAASLQDLKAVTDVLGSFSPLIWLVQPSARMAARR